MASEFYTVTEAAKVLDMSSDNVRYLERTGRLNALRIGKQRVFFRSEIERYRRKRDAEQVERRHDKEAAEAVHV